MAVGTRRTGVRRFWHPAIYRSGGGSTGRDLDHEVFPLIYGVILIALSFRVRARDTGIIIPVVLRRILHSK